MAEDALARAKAIAAKLSGKLIYACFINKYVIIICSILNYYKVEFPLILEKEKIDLRMSQPVLLLLDVSNNSILFIK